MQKEIYEVTIEYCTALFSKEIEKTEVKVFSTEELAKVFLVKNGFVYGAPYPFKYIGWYYSRSVNQTIDIINRFITASITKLEIDDESVCKWKYSNYLFGKKEADGE